MLRPEPTSPSFLTESDLGEFQRQRLREVGIVDQTAQRAASRRRHERRRVVIDAVFTALGVKPRRYPQTLEERLERALANVACDRGDRGDT